MKLSLREFFVHEAKSLEESPHQRHFESFDDWADELWNYAQARYNIDAPRLNNWDETEMYQAFMMKQDPMEFVDEKLRDSALSMDEHQDPTTKKDVGGSIWSSPNHEVDVKKFFNHEGNLSIDLEEGGPGSGRKKGSKNKPRDVQITPGKEVDLSQLPDELPDDWFDDESGSAAAANPNDDTPFARAAGDLGDDEEDLSFLDDPNYGAGVELPKPEPRAAKTPRAAVPAHAEPAAPEPEMEPEPERLKFPSEEYFEWSFEEIRDEHPEEAADIETELGSVEGARFARGHGFLYMITKDGERWMYSQATGWLPYDDLESPVGEF